MAKRHITFVILALLTACTGRTDELPPAVPLPRIATTPALEPWVARWLTAYHAEQGAPEFEVEVLPPAAALKAAEDGDVALIVSGVEIPADWFASTLGFEGIAVLVHPENIVRSFSLNELASIFTGRLMTWDELGGSGGEIMPLIPLVGDEVRELFEDTVMGGAPSTSNAILAPSPQAMIALVAANPNSIGYAPLAMTSDDVRVVRVEGALPGQSSLTDGTYALMFEVVAAAPQEPTGAIRDWLVWLQTDRPEDVLSEE